MTKQIRISNAAMTALAWFAFETGAFGDSLDRAPESALVTELRSAGLLTAGLTPTAKGDALLAEIKKSPPKKGEARAAFAAAYKASEATAKPSGQGFRYDWITVELDGLGREIKIRASRFGARNILGFELRGALYVCRATRAGAILKTREYGPKLDLNNWIDTLLAHRDEVMLYV